MELLFRSFSMFCILLFTEANFNFKSETLGGAKPYYSPSFVFCFSLKLTPILNQKHDFSQSLTRFSKFLTEFSKRVYQPHQTFLQCLARTKTPFSFHIQVSLFAVKYFSWTWLPFSYIVYFIIIQKISVSDSCRSHV